MNEQEGRFVLRVDSVWNNWAIPHRSCTGTTYPAIHKRKMATGPSSTPVKVPASATSYTPATQDQDLRSQINAILIRDGHIVKYVLPPSALSTPNPPSYPQANSSPSPRIQETLLHALNAHSSNWPTLLQTHALTLLRSGEVTSFPALLSRVLDDVRSDTLLSSPSSHTNGTNGSAIEVKKPNGTSSDDKPNLALPQAVLDEALKVTRESLEEVCEIEPDKT